MDKTYDPQPIETKWYQVWEANGYFSPSGVGKPYCIMIPPPNVTGILHMGHAFQNSLIDALIRYHRMRNCNTLWQVGIDHAGIATQMVVERQLLQQNSSRHELGREQFVQRIWQWKQQSGGTITKQLRRLGASVDWSQERFTMDEGLSHAVQKVFIDLYREGLIYRGQRLVNWDPVLGTAISDLEVITEEEPGNLWHIRYPLMATNDNETPAYLTVATTRPETMLGDTALAVNPTDERYQHLIGKQVHVPLTDRTIPIIADEYVDPAFATGCVKITPAHDFNDYEVAQRHKLPLLNILTLDAKINSNAPKAYQGLDRFAARQKIVAVLQEQKLLTKTENYAIKIPRGDRSKTVVEPMLTDQWFVKVAPLAQPAVAAVKQGKIKFIPDNWSKTYFEWMANIKDWCISRQLWWGHRIPAWYDTKGNVYVGGSEAEVREFYQLKNDVTLTQDQDVLDTWFSSALWPFSTLGWPEDTENLRTFFPTDVLITGFDIIFFWVARMIMLSLKFTKQIPFHTVYIHGLIQDQHGQKMSKSKGNILDPLDIIDGISLDQLIAKRTTGLMQPQMAKQIELNTKKEYPNGIANFGTDALRFTFYSIATTGRFIRFDLARVGGYRNFCNKLWNASRYVLMNTAEHSNDLAAGTKILSLADKWIQSHWQTVKGQVIEHLEKYRFDLVAQDLYEFIWNEYCDWYLELSKPVLYSENNNAATVTAAVADNAAARLRGTRYTLLMILEEILRVAHPFLPFITEEIWQTLSPLVAAASAAKHPLPPSLMLHSFPEPQPALIDSEIEQTITWLQSFIVGIRTIRSEMNIAPSKALPVLLLNTSTREQALVDDHAVLLKALAKLASIQYLNPEDSPPAAATALVGDMQILIPLAGVIDLQAEINRLEREIAKLSQELQRAQTKLANPNYTAKAKPEVVTKERQRLTELQGAIDKLQQSMHIISVKDRT